MTNEGIGSKCTGGCENQVIGTGGNTPLNRLRMTGEVRTERRGKWTDCAEMPS